MDSNHTAQSQSLTLREYQSSLIQGIYESWKVNRRVMAQLPTGGGKTVIFSAIAGEFTRRDERVLILAHREELITQAARKLETVTRSPVGIIKAGYPLNPLFPIQVASVQTMINRLKHFESFGLIVIDEAHHSPADTYRRILNAYPEAYQLGVTATPIRTDGTGFDDLFDALVTGPTVGELIKEGHLSPFKLFADAKPMTTKGAKTVGGDFSTGDIAKANDIIALSGNLIESYGRHCPGGRCLVFAVNVEHSMAIAARYSASGIPAIHLDGESPPETRKEALAAFSRGEIKVISNCALFGEGLDIPAIDAVQIARPTKSLGLWLQMVGRALRPAPGKELAVLIDHTKNWAIHGLPTRKRTWTLEGVEQEPEKTERGKNGEVQTVSIEIVEDTSTQLMEILEDSTPIRETPPATITTMEDYWREWFMDVVSQAQLKGYQPGWIYHRLVKARPPLEIWKAYAKLRGYHPKWAVYRYEEMSQG